MNMPPELLEGYRRFRQDRFANEAERYRSLAREQHPRTMVIGCADSRVDPATIFAAAPGELFVARNVAALVPPCEQTGSFHGTSAALEFAVDILQVENVIILGHGMCGGVAAALSGTQERPVGRFIQPWVELLSDVRDQVVESIAPDQPAARQIALEHLGVQKSLANLKTFPFVAERIAAGTLVLHGAWFSIAQGELHWLDTATDQFVPIDVDKA
ncbi:MAG: carbonic anhydrase [Hyphomicrobiaceae bacterium]